jgi:hypothetical protein
MTVHGRTRTDDKSRHASLEAVAPTAKVAPEGTIRFYELSVRLIVLTGPSQAANRSYVMDSGLVTMPGDAKRSPSTQQ